TARIRPGRYQPRTRMDEQALAELAQSIRSQGLLQPLVVRPVERGYELIAGERRWRAAQMAGLAQVPAVVREVPDDAALVMALIENIQREDLNPMEEAAGVQRLIDEFKMTAQQAADAGDLARLEEELSERLGTTVQIRAARKGRGQLVLHYSSLEHLEQLLKRLK